nr:hypothetical protein [Bacteroidota bacterium]
MTIRELLREEVSRHHAEEIAKMVEIKPELFDLLWGIALSDEQPINWRAAWVIKMLWERNADIVSPYVEEMCRQLPNLTADGPKREFLKIISENGLPRDEELVGVLLKTCFDWLASPVEAIAVKAHAMQILFDICIEFPEIIPELKITIELAMQEGSAGIVSRGRRILQEISQLAGKRK